MIVLCPHCHKEHEAAHLPVGALKSCACGKAFPLPEPQPFDPIAIRCGSCGAALSAGKLLCGYCGSAHKPFDHHRFCPSCLAYFQTDSKFCSHCGRHAPEAMTTTATIFTSQQDVGGEDATTQLHCPRDGQPLLPSPIGQHHGEICEGCGGIWLKHEALKKILEDQRQAPATIQILRPLGLKRDAPSTGGIFAQSPQKRLYSNCPKCGTQMARANYLKVSGVILDSCPDHGIWLDSNELMRLSDFLKAGGDIQARKMELDEIERQAKHRAKIRRIEEQSQGGD